MLDRGFWKMMALAAPDEVGAAWVVLFPLLFDIARYLKGYAGGLIVIRSRSLHIGSLGKPMMRVSASLFVGSRK